MRRHVDDLITLDVFLHAHGIGTSWAASAQPGDRVGLDHARSWYRPPADTDVFTDDSAGGTSDPNVGGAWYTKFSDPIKCSVPAGATDTSGRGDSDGEVGIKCL